MEEYRVAPQTMLRGVSSNTVSRCDKSLQGAEIENMEGAALFAMAETMGLRVMQIRAISNRVGESFEMWHINEALEALARELKKFDNGEQSCKIGDIALSKRHLYVRCDSKSSYRLWRF